jgi:hypothetical protein
LSRASSWTAALVAVALSTGVALPSAQDAEALRELDRRLKAYVELRQQQERALPPLAPRETDGVKIREHARALARAMKKARSAARQGDVLHPGVQQHLIGLVRAQLAGDRAERSAIEQGNPGRLFLVVNADYPEGGSWSTVPPGLLAKLPPLPDDLQYRFADRHLLLVDMRAHILVDFLPKAAPR